MLVWIIVIACVSLSCEPMPIFVGWFDGPDECIAAAQQIIAAWKPDIRLYNVHCFERLAA